MSFNVHHQQAFMKHLLISRRCTQGREQGEQDPPYLWPLGNSRVEEGETGHLTWGTFSQQQLSGGRGSEGQSEWTEGGSLADGMAEDGKDLKRGLARIGWAEKEERWAQRGRG